MAYTYPLIPSVLNNFLVIGENIFPKFCTKPKPASNDVKKKNGSNDGSIAVAQS
jgi:hypothetical protein